MFVDNDRDANLMALMKHHGGARYKNTIVNMGWTTSQIRKDKITGTLFSDASGGQPATITVPKSLQERVTPLA